MSNEKNSNHAKGLQPDIVSAECIFEVDGQLFAVAFGGAAFKSPRHRAQEKQKFRSDAANCALKVIGEPRWQMGLDITVRIIIL